MDSDRQPLLIADDQELAALVALSALPGLTPRRLWEVLALGPPTVGWHRIQAGGFTNSARNKDPSVEWSQWARGVDPAGLLAAHRNQGVQILPFGSARYPSLLTGDPDPPAVLYRLGQTALDERIVVAVVGTRRCTRYGRRVAQELGAALAARGIVVVSGLAQGIDAAAHAGASGVDPAACVGVVASGLDVVYPQSNRDLWHRVATQGTLLSEWPLGSTARPWRFPARNRLVAALAAVTVVVESAVRGGSLYTVDEALRRDRSVFAVPGSINSPVSLGCNQLIADGAQILPSVEQFADALGPAVTQLKLEVEPSMPAVEDSWLLRAIGWEPITIDGIVAVSDRSPIDVTLEIERQIAAGRIARHGSVVERLR